MATAFFLFLQTVDTVYKNIMEAGGYGGCRKTNGVSQTNPTHTFICVYNLSVWGLSAELAYLLMSYKNEWLKLVEIFWGLY